MAVSAALAAHLRDWGTPPWLIATMPNFMPDAEFAAESRAGEGEFPAWPPVA